VTDAERLLLRDSLAALADARELLGDLDDGSEAGRLEALLDRIEGLTGRINAAITRKPTPVATAR
jgi:hypothetical protein